MQIKIMKAEYFPQAYYYPGIFTRSEKNYFFMAAPKEKRFLEERNARNYFSVSSISETVNRHCYYPYNFIRTKDL